MDKILNIKRKKYKSVLLVAPQLLINITALFNFFV